MEDADRFARLLWDYHQLHDAPKPCEAAVVLGSHDIRVADHAVAIYEQQLAPLFVFSGGSAPATRRFYEGTEASAFADRARAKGMPAEVIRLEERATNTAENLRFSLEILAAEGIHPASLLLVQKPYMERRSKATADVVCPSIEVVCTSPPIPFEAYPVGEVTKEHFINTMVGDFQRILEYPKLGFMTEQEVPPEVIQAYEKLLRLGFTKRLL